MKHDRIPYALVGGFVLTMAVALFVVLTLVTGRQGPSEHYEVRFDNVTGVKYGTAVLYEGYRIGQVEQVTPEPGAGGMRYRLALSVRRDWPIPSDSVARLASSGLIAAVSVAIDGGKAEALLAPGDEIATASGGGLFETLDGAATDFQDLSRNSIRPLLATMDARLNQVADELVSLRREDLSPLLSGLDSRLNDDLFGRLGEILDRLDSVVGSVDAMLGEDNRERIDGVLLELHETSETLGELLSGIDQTRERLDHVVVGVGALVDENGPVLGRTLGQLSEASTHLNVTAATVAAEIDTIVYHLGTTSRNMSEFSRAIRDNPSRVLRNAPAPEAGEP